MLVKSLKIKNESIFYSNDMIQLKILIVDC